MSEARSDDVAPWRREREELTAARVRGIVRARFAEIACEQVAFVGAGWDFDVWRVDDWAFRFPKRDVCAHQQAHEARVLTCLHDRLPVEVPAPRWRGEPGQDFPFTFVGSRWLEGLGGDVASPATARWSAFAEQYGKALAALHAVDPAVLRDVPLEHDRVPIEDRLREYADWFPRAFTEEGVAWALKAAREPEGGDGCAPVLVHNDLSPEHWLLDAQGGLCAIIDWTDVCWGDAVNDFASLWIWFGDDMLRRALAVYPTASAHFFERVRARGAALVLIWVAQGERWSHTPVFDRALALPPRFRGLLRNP